MTFDKQYQYKKSMSGLDKRNPEVFAEAQATFGDIRTNIENAQYTRAASQLNVALDVVRVRSKSSSQLSPLREASNSIGDSKLQSPFMRLHNQAAELSAVPEVAESEFVPRFQTTDMRCHFNNRPSHVFLVKRLHSPHVDRFAVALVKYLTSKHQVTVIVEPDVLEDMTSKGADVRTWNTLWGPADIAHHVDFTIALGGDGTLLWVSQLFPEAVPLVVGIGMGSLGYLTQFSVKDTKSIVGDMMDGAFHVSLRCRLCIQILSDAGAILQTFTALNECVVDRGVSSQLANLDVYVNEHLFTNVAADGLIIATPTGSSAYSMSAGGSICHPKVPCMLFTPICPHSLSFRPLILPDHVCLKIVVPPDSRGSAWVAADGKNRTELTCGMSVAISLSPFPLPVVNNTNLCKTGDPWLKSLQQSLNWNVRVRQQALSSLSDDLTLPDDEPCLDDFLKDPALSTTPMTVSDSTTQNIGDPATLMTPEMSSQKPARHTDWHAITPERKQGTCTKCQPRRKPRGVSRDAVIDPKSPDRIVKIPTVITPEGNKHVSSSFVMKSPKSAMGLFPRIHGVNGRNAVDSSPSAAFMYPPQQPTTTVSLTPARSKPELFRAFQSQERISNTKPQPTKEEAARLSHTNTN
eukprot:Platyproteum_vivax@DN6185_c0_g1_i1.p1